MVEARNRKANGLLTAAERILKGIQHRAERFASADELHSYFAADLMVEKVRDQIQQLIDLGDTVKADDLQSRLKTVREDALRLHAFMADTKAGVGSFFGRMFQSIGEPAGAAAKAAPVPATDEGISEEEDSWLQAMVEADGALDPLERALLKALAED